MVSVGIVKDREREGVGNGRHDEEGGRKREKTGRQSTYDWAGAGVIIIKGEIRKGNLSEINMGRKSGISMEKKKSIYITTAEHCQKRLQSRAKPSDVT